MDWVFEPWQDEAGHFKSLPELAPDGGIDVWGGTADVSHWSRPDGAARANLA